MILLRRVAVLWIVLAAALGAIEREPLDTYRQRREALAARHSDGIVLLFAFTEREGQFTRSPFRQENNFYYLSGWNEPGAVICLLGEDKAGPPVEILFLPRRDAAHEAWTGRRLGADDPDAAAISGFKEVRPLEDLAKVVSGALKDRRRVYTLKPRETPGYEQPPEPDHGARLEELAPGDPQVDIRESVEAMRSVKAASEVQLIRKATEASMAAHLAAWTKMASGIYEYQIAAAMLAVTMDHGCLRAAYTPIIGSGMNATVLHYSQSTRQMKSGELVVMDFGGEYGHYAADITRTVPVDGRFTARQREIYEIVLGAQQAALDAIKPGMTLGGQGKKSLTEIVRDYFNSHGRDQDGKPLGPYFIHGLGHHVGLEVHDPGDSGAPLKPGMVVTIEPGLYLPKENIGVRIEDMVLITEDGAEVLSNGLPKDPDEIERLMKTRSAEPGAAVTIQ